MRTGNHFRYTHIENPIVSETWDTIKSYTRIVNYCFTKNIYDTLVPETQPFFYCKLTMEWRYTCKIYDMSVPEMVSRANIGAGNIQPNSVLGLYFSNAI